MEVETRRETLHLTVIRRAGPQDRGALLSLYRHFEPKAEALGLPPLREEDAERWLAGLADFPNFLACLGDLLLGHAVVCPENDTAEVAVFVHQDYRGCGVGRSLLTELIAEARRLGLRRIWGVAAPDNVPMLRLAASCGFVPGSELGEFYLDLR